MIFRNNRQRHVLRLHFPPESLLGTGMHCWNRSAGFGVVPWNRCFRGSGAGVGALEIHKCDVTTVLAQEYRNRHVQLCILQCRLRNYHGDSCWHSVSAGNGRWGGQRRRGIKPGPAWRRDLGHSPKALPPGSVARACSPAISPCWRRRACHHCHGSVAMGSARMRSRHRRAGLWLRAICAIADPKPWWRGFLDSKAVIGTPHAAKGILRTGYQLNKLELYKPQPSSRLQLAVATP